MARVHSLGPPFTGLPHSRERLIRIELTLGECSLFKWQRLCLHSGVPVLEVFRGHISAVDFDVKSLAAEDLTRPVGAVVVEFLPAWIVSDGDAAVVALTRFLAERGRHREAGIGKLVKSKI